MPAVLIHLPPNLPAAAGRDAVAVKVEIGAAAPPPELLPGLALLASWTDGKDPGGRPLFMQLNRAKLRALVAAFRGQGVFVRTNEPQSALPWNGDRLTGVSEYLAEPEPAAEPKPPRSPDHHPEGASALPASFSSPAAGRSRADTPVVEGRSGVAAGLIVDGSDRFLALTLPSREHPRYAEALALVRENGFILEPSNRQWWLRDRARTLRFLAASGERLRSVFGARFTASFTARTARLAEAEIVCETASSGRTGFEVTLGIRAGDATDAAIREAVASGRGFVESGDRVFLLDPARVSRLSEAQRALAGSPRDGAGAERRTHRVGAARAAEVEEVLENLLPGWRPPEAWRTQTDSLRTHTRLEPAPVPEALGARMRPYQKLGAAWLWHLHRNGLGGILADEMGLGKTIQALALLTAVRSADDGKAAEAGCAGGRGPRQKPSLVVCPASLLENWRREAALFAPGLAVRVHHGSARADDAAELELAGLVITSYGTLARDRDLLGAIDFACVIGDEAQHVKNRRSQNALALRSLRADGRFLLTGTPVENALDDLRSLLDFVLPGYVARPPAGADAEERAWLDSRLRAQAAPYLLRRTKRSVAPELPARIEQVVWCELEPRQAALYRETQERSERELIDLEASGAGEARLRFAALTQLLRLRQICCDPRLIPSADGAARPAEQGSDSSSFLAPSSAASKAGSAKLEAFLELLSEAVDDGHRLLVFSQFTSLLSLLQEELAEHGTAFCRLDGSMAAAARQSEVDRFQAADGPPVFLLSLKAGGAGLNLTAADTVVHFDPWWNPAAEAQATDRAHRIGQARVVTSYKLVCSGTVEERVLALQEQKRALLADVFEASDEAAARLSLGDLRSLLGR